MVGSRGIAPIVESSIDGVAVVVRGVDAVFCIVEYVVVMGSVVLGIFTPSTQVNPDIITMNCVVLDDIVVRVYKADTGLIVVQRGVIRERVVEGVVKDDAVKPI